MYKLNNKQAVCMQEKNLRKSNKQRTEETQARLMKAARALFVEKGYAETSTPEIVKTAEVTRGALYHHFEDKLSLFRAVYTTEAKTVSEEIDAVTSRDMKPIDAMIIGANAYFDAMQKDGRARLLLIDGPAALSIAEIREIDKETGGESLRQGLEYLKETHNLDIDPASVADLLSSMFDRAALAIQIGEDSASYRAMMEKVMRNLLD
jgi:AcrR family transcriptional regulator